MGGRQRADYAVVDGMGIDHLADVRDRAVSEITDQYQIVLGQKYAGRPDLFAFDVYGDSELWWVIMHNNGIVTKHDFIGGLLLNVPSPVELDYVLSSLTRKKTDVGYNTSAVYV